MAVFQYLFVYYRKENGFHCVPMIPKGILVQIALLYNCICCFLLRRLEVFFLFKFPNYYEKLMQRGSFVYHI